MALILDDPRSDRRQFRHLMTVCGSRGPRLLDLPRKAMPAVLALLGQHRSNLIDSLRRRQAPVASAVAWLSAHFPPALAPLPPSLSWIACQPIGGRWLGGVRRVLLSQCELPFQIGDLLLLLGDLLLFFGDLLLLLDELLRLLTQLLAQLLVLATQALVLAAQSLASRRESPLWARSSMRGSQRLLNI